MAGILGKSMETNYGVEVDSMGRLVRVGADELGSHSCHSPDRKCEAFTDKLGDLRAGQSG